MREYVTELVLCTIVAAVVTLLIYIIGMDHSWQDAANTFGVTFLVMFIIGIFNRLKKKQQ
jgi:hypothetical protein